MTRLDSSLLLLTPFLLLTTTTTAASTNTPSLRTHANTHHRHLSQFINPQIKDLPLDYCLHYETVHYGPNNSLISKHGLECGKPAADLFCEKQGFDLGSEFFTAMYYSHNATWVLGDEEENPKDVNMGHGEHTYFDKISCKLPDEGGTIGGTNGTMPLVNNNNNSSSSNNSSSTSNGSSSSSSSTGTGGRK